MNKEEDKLIPVTDTIYNFSQDAPSNAVQRTIVATNDKLHETTVEERKKQVITIVQRHDYKIQTRKTLARSIVSIWDHADEILGLIERVLILAIAELFRRGDLLTAVAICVLTIVAWLVKIRKPSPGPVVAFFKQSPAQFRAKLADLSKTIYK